MRARSVLFLLLLPAAVLSAAMSSGTGQESVPGQPRLGGTLRIKPFIKVFKPDLDPASNAPYYVLEQLYDGLVRLDGNYNVMPSLAEYWVISGDGRICTFTLRKGARFHHGREVTSDDVKFSLERLLRKDTGALYAQYFLSKVVGAEAVWAGKAAEVTGFRARDRHTFEIEWKDPYVSGLYLLSMPFCKVLPRDLVTAQGRGFFQKPSGTGAFRFGNWLRDSRLEITGVRLEKNRDYFGEIAYLDAVAETRGKFEIAGRGTLFLDEIGDISPNLQSKLLRVIETRDFMKVGGERVLKTEARIVAATNQNLAALIEKGRFREDLFYRLKVVEIALPPLRERKDDIPTLAAYLLEKINRELRKNVRKVPEDVMKVIMDMPWRGNVRELENALTRAVILAKGDVILKENLPLEPSEKRVFPRELVSLKEVEKGYIRHVLAATHGSKTRTSQILGISRPTLDKKIREYGLELPPPA